MSLQRSKRGLDLTEAAVSHKRTFRDLIKCHRHGTRPLSESSQKVLHESVFQLVGIHQDTRTLVSEVLGSQDTAVPSNSNKYGKTVLLQSVLDTLQQLESKPQQSLTLTLTENCVQHLLQCGNRSTDVKDAGNTETSIQLIHTLMQQHKFNMQHFMDLITKEDILPLETIWKLNMEDILTLGNYMTRKLSDDRFVRNFSRALYSLCKKLDIGHTDLNTSCLVGIICFLINTAFPEKKDKDTSLRKLSVGILDKTIKYILDTKEESATLQPYVGLAYCDNALNSLSFKRFCTHSLSLLMSHRSSLKVSQAFKEQSKWKSAKVNCHVSSLYKQMFLPFESCEILEILQRILERQEVNWQTVMSFIATYLVCFADAAKLVQNHVHLLLSEGLENADMESTIVAFLLVRQCCQEGLHVFPPYQDWFQQTFGDSNRSPASSRKSFTFLMKFLTNIVPYESAQILKVHILRPPHVPAKCRPLLVEYISLAKTRLTDLKESCEVIGGIYDSSVSDNATQQVDLVEADVQKSLSAFESTGKVPTTIMEASIFRKPYFIGRYLQALLKPRHLPDKADIRMRLIAALKKSNKIPMSMYTKYEEACQREARQLLEGVFDDDSEDDVMQDAILPPLEQLKFRLDQLHGVVTERSGDSCQQTGQRQKVGEVLSMISEKLENLLKSDSKLEQTSSPSIVISLTTPDLSPHHLQVVDTVLNAVCHTLTSDLHTVTSDLQPTSPLLTWLTQLVKMLSQHRTIHRPFVQRIVWLICKEGPNLSFQHITGLSALVTHLSSLQCHFGEILIQDKTIIEHHKSSNLIQSLVSCLPLHTTSALTFALRFITTYMEHAILNYSRYEVTCQADGTAGVISPCMLKVFCLLCWRILPVTRRTSSNQSDLPSTSHSLTGIQTDHLSSGHLTTSQNDHPTAVELYTSDKLQQMLKASQVSFEEWVAFEIKTSANDDSLSDNERLEYYSWVAYEHYMSDPGETCSDIQTMCSTLVSALVNAQCVADSLAACKKCNKGDNSRRNNGQAMQALLQMLVVHLPPCVTKPWLIGQLESVARLHVDTATNANGSVSTQCNVIAFVSLVCQLPSHLWIVNRLCYQPNEQTMSSVLQVLECVMAPYVAESCWLPLYVTLHILQGALTLRHSDGSEPLLKQLVNHPLVAISILVHWSTVSRLLQADSSNNDNALLGDCSQAEAWAESCARDGAQPDPSPPHWLCGVALFCQVLHHTDRIPPVTDVLNAGNMSTEVVFSFMELCLLQLAANRLYERPQDRTLVAALFDIIRKHPHMLVKLAQCPQLEARVASHGARSFRKSVLLQAICGMTIGEIQDIATVAMETMSCLMRLYSEVCSQFEQSTDEKCISWSSLSPCADVLKKVLSSISLQCLQKLDQEDLLSAGSDFHYLVRSRLLSGR